MHTEVNLQRRHVLQLLAGLGIGSTVFQRALAVRAAGPEQVTVDMVRQAAWVAGLELREEDLAATASTVQSAQDSFRVMRSVPLGYDVPPAIAFRVADVEPAANRQPESPSPPRPAERTVKRPPADDDLAFLPVTHLAELLRTRQISSVELTKLYLERLHRYDKTLHCVVSFTDDLALRQAERADREIAAGRYRGPLHGVPWGAKDLIAYPGYKTTWGAPQFQDQVLDSRATVAKKLDDAGAVLVAKLTLGALAWGDEWFGGLTRNPWNPQQGSSGSSAGSASAAAAGLVGFAIGSETLGSIVSPCLRCGATGLRPTFGRVSRTGCMPLAWSMDKLGPITRSVEDCALVFAAIHGADGVDTTAVDRPFEWPCRKPLDALKVGYVENGREAKERPDLRVLTELGCRLVSIELPDPELANHLDLILYVEAAAVFDELTRRGMVDGLKRWPNAFRQGQFTPAVEYLRANRLRTQLMAEMNDVFEKVDLYVGGSDLVITNLTGHPTVVLPNGLVRQGHVETPTGITFTGQLFRESELLAVAQAYQQATGHHQKRPPLPAAGAE